MLQRFDREHNGTEFPTWNINRNNAGLLAEACEEHGEDAALTG
jgi:hypothetical protein